MHRGCNRRAECSPLTTPAGQLSTRSAVRQRSACDGVEMVSSTRLGWLVTAGAARRAARHPTIIAPTLDSAVIYT